MTGKQVTYQKVEMGSSASKTNSQETPDQRRRRDIQRYGVLIPPVFVVSSSGNNNSTSFRTSDRISPCQEEGQSQELHHRDTASLSAHDRLPLSPSLVEYLTVTHFGHALLKDFMTPGMWILAGGTDASQTATTTVRASLPITSTQSHVSFASLPVSKNSRVEVCAGTDGPMHLFATHQVFPRCFIFANTNSCGNGYVGAQVGMSIDRTKRSRAFDTDELLGNSADDDNDLWDSSTEMDSTMDAINVQIGSWVPLQWNKKIMTPKELAVRPQYQPQSSKNAFTAALPNWMQSPQHVHGFLSIDMLGSTTAVETKWNTGTFETEVAKYFFIRLDGPVGGGDDSAATSPPLWLTMTSNPKSSAINISQLLSFDRINLNPLDTRAPKVRNTFGWTVQVEKPARNDCDSLEVLPSQVSVAAAWQYNRVLAFKLVGTSAPNNICATLGEGNGSSRNYACTLGVLLKRWKQPRLTCSFLGRFDFQTQTSSFVGVGLELETDTSTLLGQMGTGDHANFFYTPPAVQVSDKGIPETKISLG